MSVVFACVEVIGTLVSSGRSLYLDKPIIVESEYGKTWLIVVVKVSKDLN